MLWQAMLSVGWSMIAACTSLSGQLAALGAGRSWELNNVDVST